jgi:alpha-galactosidase
MQNDDHVGGSFIAFGWTGQWKMSVTRLANSNSLNVSGEIPDLDISLKPGEEIEGPSVLVGVYGGTIFNGSNRLRRLIRNEYTPKLAGNMYLPVAIRSSYWTAGVSFDESILKAQVDWAAETRQEYFLLDAGWYAGTGKARDDFSPGVGNWYHVDNKKLPNGLKPIADYVHSKGLKFGLWFEPERVAPGSELAKNHHEWILWNHTWEPEDEWTEWNKGYGVLDLGKPEVQRWVRGMLDHYIDSYGLDFIRYDFNIEPLSYWNYNDPPRRHGITQIRYIEGFYSTIDWLRKKHPKIVFEGCASGGRRIDLETVRRFHAFWISDYSVDPSIIRFHLFGVHTFLPGNYLDVEYTLPAKNQNVFYDDDLGFASMFGGAFGIGSGVDGWPSGLRDSARGHVETWMKLRRYLVEDYYPLSGQPGDLRSWSGWQFHDPEKQSGFLQVFRTDTPEERRHFRLFGLDSAATYRFQDSEGRSSFDMSGSDAAASGLEVDLPVMSSKVLIYRKLED